MAMVASVVKETEKDTLEMSLTAQSPIMKLLAASPLQWIHPSQPALTYKSTRDHTINSKVSICFISGKRVLNLFSLLQYHYMYPKL